MVRGTIFHAMCSVSHDRHILCERNRYSPDRPGAALLVNGEMFVLRYYEGHDNREIAKIMGTSQMVVGVVLHRARTKLRREIGHYLEKHHE